MLWNEGRKKLQHQYAQLIFFLFFLMYFHDLAGMKVGRKERREAMCLSVHWHFIDWKTQGCQQLRACCGDTCAPNERLRRRVWEHLGTCALACYALAYRGGLQSRCQRGRTLCQLYEDLGWHTLDESGHYLCCTSDHGRPVTAWIVPQVVCLSREKGFWTVQMSRGEREKANSLFGFCLISLSGSWHRLTVSILKQGEIFIQQISLHSHRKKKKHHGIFF